MESMIEARLTIELGNSDMICGFIHSKFRSAINISFQMPDGRHRLVTVMRPRMNGVPDSIIVSDAYFERIALLDIGTKVYWKGLRFYFDSVPQALLGNKVCVRKSELFVEGSNVAVIRPVDFSNQFEYLKTNGKKTYFHQVEDNENSWQQVKARTGVYEFACAWSKGKLKEVEEILMEYIGLGIGLTPSCDDAFLGMIALYSGARDYTLLLENKQDGRAKAWKQLLDIRSLPMFDELLMKRTTDVSMKYLCCAQEGRFSDSIVRLVKVILAGERKYLRSSMAAVAEVGGTSGMDTLFGMQVALNRLFEMLFLNTEERVC